MNKTEMINIDGKLAEFTTVATTNDRPVLQISAEKNTILSMCEEKTELEFWFCIELEKKSFDDYIAGEMTLLEALRKGRSRLGRRDFGNYSEVVITSDSINFDEVNLPEENSYFLF